MIAMKLDFVTIGVYGYTETDFFQALVDAGVDVFCDVRARRGMRGSTYAFVNSTYLQQKLKHLRIAYVHHKDLAPSDQVRQAQKTADAAQHIQKRSRETLGTAFIQRYEAECLTRFDSHAFVNNFAPGTRKVALFCVERAPVACHRSLIARRLEQDLGITVQHITP
jgi:uncharacterized protein (DUF488 family)